MGTSCSQVIAVSFLIIPQSCLGGGRQVCRILSFSQQVDVTDNTVYDILPNLPSISHKRDILLLSADSCLLPQLVQNSWGQEESYLLFSFSSLAASLSHSFFVCFVCCPSLVGSQTQLPLVKHTETCIILQNVLLPHICSSHRCHCVQDNIYFLLNSAHLLCISPAVSTPLLYCVLSGAFPPLWDIF